MPKRSTFKRRRQNSGVKALRIVKSMQKARELKFLDEDINLQNVDESGQILALARPPQGLTDQQRIGDKIELNSLTLKMRAAQSGGQNAHMRVILYLDKANTITSVSDLLLGVTTASFAPLKHYNKDKRKEFRILLDKNIILTSVGLNVVYKQFFKRLKIPVVFNAGSQTVVSNALKICLISNAASSASTSNKPNFFAIMRTKYLDS